MACNYFINFLVKLKLGVCTRVAFNISQQYGEGRVW